MSQDLQQEKNLMKDLLAVVKLNSDDTTRRFEDMNKKIEEKFEDMNKKIEEKFEDMNKKFEDKFEDMNK